MYLEILETGLGFARKAAEIAVATVLVLLVAVPLLAVGAAIVA